MKPKSRVSEVAPHRQKAHERPRAKEISNRRRMQASAAPTAPSILDAVRDQHGDSWIRFGTHQRATWFAVPDLISDASTVFRRLSRVGLSCLTSTTQNAFRRAVEDHDVYREALVATRPGWLEGFYLFGDGELASPASDGREVIVTFEPNRKFRPRGSLADWQAEVGPVVAGQPLLYFGLALALTGPLLRFTPAGYLNPQAEVIADGEKGKTGVGRLAVSIWAGNPDSDAGGGESWDVTLNSLDVLKLAHRDGFLFLDEGNLAGVSSREQKDFVRQAVFKIAATGGKRRMGDAIEGEHARVALFSTSNTALSDLIDGTAEVRNAARSRMITIRIPDAAPHGIFATVPNGYATARAATEALQAATDKCWGTAGRGFIARLVRQIELDEDRLKRFVAKRLDSYMRQDSRHTGSARVQKTFALVAVAAELAHRWEIFPEAWGSPVQMIQAVAQIARESSVSVACDPLVAIRAYVERHRADLVDVAGLMQPLAAAEFEATAGFLRQGSRGTELLVPAPRFQAAFPNYEVMMRGLRQSEQAQTEGGRKPKLTIKCPKTICPQGRVYCIRLGQAAERRAT